jgi:hypothetical protein
MSGRKATSWLVVKSVMLIAVATTCTTTPSGESATPATTPTEAPSPSPTRLPRLPTAEARLDGRYEVRLFTTSNTFDSKPQQDQIFRFLPRCDEGACDVTISGAMEFGQGAADREAAGAEKRFDLRLANLGRTYRGTKVDYWASCGDEPDKDRWTFSIRIDKAKYLDEVWTVVRWSGTWTRQANFASLCRGGRLRAVIRGTVA